MTTFLSDQADVQYVEGASARFAYRRMEPSAVARVILRAATTRPRLRYPVGQDGKVLLLLKRLLPESAFEALKRRLFSA